MASSEATCEASQYETPPSSKVERRSRESGYMREKHGREESGTASRWLQTKDLLCPEPRSGIAAEKPPPARLGQRRTSLESLIVDWWLRRKPAAEQSEPNKRRVPVMCGFSRAT